MGKSKLRSTGEVIEVVFFKAPKQAERTPDDKIWYIDEYGSECCIDGNIYWDVVPIDFNHEFLHKQTQVFDKVINMADQMNKYNVDYKISYRDQLAKDIFMDFVKTIDATKPLDETVLNKMRASIALANEFSDQLFNLFRPGKYETFE